MKTLEEKIKGREYVNRNAAKAAVKRSKLKASEKKRLLDLIPKDYAQRLKTLDMASAYPHPIIGDDAPGKLAMNSRYGKPILAQLPGATSVNIGREQKATELDNALNALALKTLIVAVHHHLSREQVFDMLKERMYWGMDER